MKLPDSWSVFPWDGDIFIHDSLCETLTPEGILILNAWSDAVTLPYVHLNQERSGKRRVTMLSAGERGRRCKVSVTEPIKICSGRTADPDTSPCLTTSPRLPADVRAPPGKHSQVTLVCVQIPHACVFMDFHPALQGEDALHWGRWSVHETIFTFSLSECFIRVLTSDRLLHTCSSVFLFVCCMLLLHLFAIIKYYKTGFEDVSADVAAIYLSI